ncbi:MAG: rhamnulose-1-phosphate aldolase [Prevotella sp.]|jgi:rhamnulose-1-phosphate aldolase|nr:rhamnulose-1-phosphate aldolase [Prevotella sp.]
MAETIYKTSCVEGFIRLCTDGFNQGWHERNGGNLSYRLSNQDVNETRKYFQNDSKWIELGVRLKNLKNEYFLVTGTGKFMRNVCIKPEDNIGIVKLNEDGDKYRVVWGLDGNSFPTSEFPTHLMNHSIRKEISNDCDRVIYHCHPVNLIALTFVLPVSEKEITRALWKSMTECAVIFPEGVGTVKWMVPGGNKIAAATSTCMKKYRAVVWTHHGLFVTGKNYDEAFGLVHTIEKSAEIYLKIKSSGMQVFQTITDENLLMIEKSFKVHLNREFLNE